MTTPLNVCQKPKSDICYRPIVVDAEEKLSGYGLNRAAIKALRPGSHTSEFVYQYPPPLCLPTIDSDHTVKIMKKANSSEDRSIGLYIHIPFCVSICSFCHYARLVPTSDEQVWVYLRALKQETHILKYLLDNVGCEISSIHLGGGTPTYLTPDQIQFLMDFLFEAFRVRNDAEVTWETTPHDFATARFSVIRDAGGNRLSIGIQSLDKNVLRLCGRSHGPLDAIRMVNAAKSADFDNVNADVIFGLPGQNIISWIKTVEKLIEMEIPSITMYRLRILPGISLPQNAKCKLPGLRISDLMYIIGQNLLQQAGYIQTSPSCFIRSSRFLYRHQHEKSHGGEYIGLGLSAYSYFGNMVRFNTRDIEQYYAVIGEGKLPVWVGKVLTTKESLIRQVILGLRYSAGIGPDLVQHTKLRGGQELQQNLDQLCHLDLLRHTAGGWIKLTEMGQLLADEACRELYEQKYKSQLAQGGSRFGEYFTNSEAFKIYRL